MDFAFFPPIQPDDTQAFANPKWRDRTTTYTPGDENKSAGWKHDHWERDLTVASVPASDVFEQARARIISMDILPSDILDYTAQWNVEGRLPQPNDLIFQRTHLVQVGQQRIVDVLSATRIGTLTDAPGLFALQYISTSGHPERGFSVYTITQDDQSVKFIIKTISQPANLLTKLANPIITRRTQLRITNAVLDYMKTSVHLDLIGENHATD
jgi:uncharacterized protein (UPF0548 family)